MPCSVVVLLLAGDLISYVPMATCRGADGGRGMSEAGHFRALPGSDPGERALPR
jgi:hypothetical protein